MLSLYFYAPISDSNVYNIDSSFNRVKESSWFNPMAIRLIEEIDGNKYIANGVSDSPYLGIISPGELSGGIKTLIYAMNNPKVVCPLKWLGQNLSGIFEDISEEYDIRFLYCGSYFQFTETQKIYLPEFNKHITGESELWKFIEQEDLYDTVECGFKIEFKPDYENPYTDQVTD